MLDKIYHTIRLALCRSGRARAAYLKSHNLLGAIGDNVSFTPWRFPQDPKFIFLGNNVMIASDVLFINHDQSDSLINYISPEITGGGEAEILHS